MREAARSTSETTPADGLRPPSPTPPETLSAREGMLFGSLNPSGDVKMGAGQPHEVLPTMCKHHLRALLISQVRP